MATEMNHKHYEIMRMKMKVIRMAKGIPMATLGGAIGTNKSYISQVESGTIKRPPLDKVRRIAAELGVTLECLFGEDYDPNKISMHDYHRSITEKYRSEAMVEAGELIGSLHSILYDVNEASNNLYISHRSECKQALRAIKSHVATIEKHFKRVNYDY